MISAIVMFKVDRGKLHKLANDLGAIDEIVEVLSITGEYDLMARIQVRQYEALSDVVTDKLHGLDGVIETRTMTAFKTYKFAQLSEGAPAQSITVPVPAPEAPAVAGTTAGAMEEGRRIIKPVLAKLTEGFDLARNDVVSVIDGIAADTLTDAQISAFLAALMTKGPSIQEVAWIAEAMRANAIPIASQVRGDLTDTCGTGGGLTTFNVSTANAILAAAAGVPVAKHGSRSISSPSGSADVLEALGVRIDQDPQQAAQLLQEVGIAFIYAPSFHPVMGKVFGPENQLGIKSIFFTIIGPLINPLGARNHTMGVYRPELVGMMANVVAEMDFNHVLVSHGVDGLDELSLLGPTSVAEVRNGQVQFYEITPEQFGLTRCSIEDIAGGTPAENAEIIRGLFSGADRGPRRDFLTLNNGATLYISGKAGSIQEGIELSRRLIDSGAAQTKLDQLVRASQALA